MPPIATLPRYSTLQYCLETYNSALKLCLVTLHYLTVLQRCLKTLPCAFLTCIFAFQLCLTSSSSSSSPNPRLSQNSKNSNFYFQMQFKIQIIHHLIFIFHPGRAGSKKALLRLVIKSAALCLKIWSVRDSLLGTRCD